MDNRTNTIAGWVLAGLGTALGLSIVGSLMFHAERPEKMGYPIEGVVEEGAAGAAEAAAVPIGAMMAVADASHGAEVFKKCAACHTVNQGGANGIGPNLYATVGEAIAQGKAGYAFSDALKAKGGKWDFTALNHWLENPKSMAAGTKMTFAGLEVAQDRANVIAWLNTQGSNLPLPKAAAAAASEEGKAAEAAQAKPAEGAAAAATPAEAAKQ